MARCNGRVRQEKCVECEIPQLARNHYFTGKLLVERDFTEEQRYHMGKMRRHNQYLHGWGTVCGLKVKQHPNEACRDQYVIIEPGVAVDCCGREILVDHEEFFDFRERFLRWWQERMGEEAEPDETAHTLQICLRYLECGTEEVPAVFDECGTEDMACQPNRILESYEFDLLIDPSTEAREPIGLWLNWRDTRNLARAHRLEINEDEGLLYVASSQKPATLAVFDLQHHSLVRSRSVDGRIMDLAVSADGNHLFVSLSKGGHKVLVFPAQVDADPVHTLTVPGGGAEDLRLAAASDGRLYALNLNNRKVYAWRNPSSDGAAERAESESLSGSPWGIVASPDGRWVFVSNPGDGSVQVIDSQFDTSTDPFSLDAPHTITTEAPFAPYALAVAETSDGPRLYVADHDNKTLRLYNIDVGEGFPAIGVPVLLDESPIDITSSQSGRWLFVLMEGEDGKGYLQAADTHEVVLGVPDAMSASLPIGERPREVLFAPQELLLFAAFGGDESDELAGGVAVVEVIEEPCEDLFLQDLEVCPGCEDGTCVVLATVEEYVFGDELVDPLPGNGAVGSGRIPLDNLSGRHLLPSTDRIVEVIRCMLAGAEMGAGGGEQGPPGLGIDDVRVQIVDCTQTGDASIETVGGQRILKLKIPRGCDGEDGEDGQDGEDGLGIDDVEVTFVPCDGGGDARIVVRDRRRILELTIPSGCEEEVKLTHICAINWQHNGAMTLDRLNREGLLVAFDGEIMAEDIHRQSFQVLASDPEGQDRLRQCWCELVPKSVSAVKLSLDSPGHGETCRITEVGDSVSSGPANGAWFLPNNPDLLQEGLFRVVLKGDFVRSVDEEGRPGQAIDGDHLPGWLPSRPTGDGVEGGTFESWFTLRAEVFNVNHASEEDLARVSGIGAEIARAIVNRRTTEGPFESVDELVDLPGIGPATVEKLRRWLTVED